MNIGLIGAGMVAPHHIAAIKQIPEAKLIGITDKTLMKAQKLSEEFNMPVYKTWQEMLDDPRITIVDIVTLPDSHAEISISAARKGKHILLEKPMAISVEQADTILKAVQENNIRLSVNLEYRFSDDVKYLKKAVEEGRLGKLIQGDAYVKWYRPPAYYQPQGKGTWLGEGGGALITQAIHTIDLLIWIMGHVDRLFSYLQLGFVHSIESEDNAAAILKFKSGALGVIQGSTSLYPGSPERLEIHGKKGTVILQAAKIIRWDIEGEENIRDTLVTKNTVQTGASIPMAIPVENFRRSLYNLIESIKNNRKPLVNGEQARYTQSVIEAIYRSGRTGKEVCLKGV